MNSKSDSPWKSFEDFRQEFRSHLELFAKKEQRSLVAEGLMRAPCQGRCVVDICRPPKLYRLANEPDDGVVRH